MQQDAVPEVLQLLLKHHNVDSSFTVTVIKLLTTSNAMRKAISGALSGRLSLTYSSKDPREHSFYYQDFRKQEKNQDSFAAWLSRHAHLLKSLHIQDSSSFGAKLIAALRAAAASPKGLQLQSYDSDWDETNSVQVLQLLPAHSLTHLRMCITYFVWKGDDGGWDDVPVFSEDDECEREDFMFAMELEELHRIQNQHDTPQMAAALAALSNLSSLSIHGHEKLREESPVMACLSGLTRLTKLSIDSVLPNYSLLRHLPAQLKELEVTDVDRPAYAVSSHPLALGHLTALTRLHTSACHDGRSCVCVGGQDALPPNLVSMCISKVEGSLKSLTALKSLRKLTLVELPQSNSAQAALQPDNEKQTAQCLPNVAITMASSSSGPHFTCHCHPTE